MEITFNNVDITKCLEYSSAYFIGSYLIVTLFVLYLFIQDKRVGIAVSIFSLFTLCFIPYTIGYLPLTMIKLMLVVFGSFILFVSLTYNCFQDIVNKILTTIVRLNFLVLIFSANHIFIILSLIFLTITTPIFTVQNKKVKMESMLIPKDLWVVLSTIGLIIYYLFSSYFCSNASLVIIAVVIPFLMHFFNDTFLESRALSLCIFMIFNILNNSKKVLMIL